MKRERRNYASSVRLQVTYLCLLHHQIHVDNFFFLFIYFFFFVPLMRNTNPQRAGGGEGGRL